MTRTWIFAALLTLSAAAAMADPALPPNAGATVMVRAGSLWFHDRGTLRRWQQLKRAGSVEDLADYEHELLSRRDALQFTEPLEAKVIGPNAARGQVSVEMRAPGRFQGTTWLIDAGAIAP